MATYLELRSLFNDGDLNNKIKVACAEAARIIAAVEDGVAPWSQTTGAHDLRVKWAAQAIASTDGTAANILKLVLVKNKALTVVQLKGATDAALQSAVNECVDLFAKALYGV